jgi:hypothetical protein
VIQTIVVVGILLVLLGMVLTRQRRTAGRVRGARWVKTDEVFEDPRSGRTVRVWIDPADGSSHYVPEGPRRRKED